MKTKLPWAEADLIMRRYVEAFRPLCERIEPAGSYRRRAPMVGDLEIVCIPKPETDMFGTPAPLSEEHSAFTQVGWNLYGEVVLNGPRQKKIILREGIQLDLFIVLPPAQWGYILLLRTGPDVFSHRIVTARNSFMATSKGNLRGLRPSYLKCENGAIWNGSQLIPTPEEADVFSLYGLEYLQPEMRK